MPFRAHESQEYQDFLISEQRKGIISGDLYHAMLPAFTPELNILDFGCGFGYVSVYYSEKFKEHDDFHIYACDYQIDALDFLWKRIAENKFKNITPFHMPDQSRLHCPKWVPVADHLFFSFSLSATDNPVDILKTIRPLISEKTLIHVIDWDKNRNHEKMDVLYPVRSRLDAAQVKDCLERTGYSVIRDYKLAGPCYAFTCRLNPENGG
ncbi:MAG: class I SAM-dependent methyltransferase [Spirochaetia bacterium]|nr:class I SAM-dependent methyltransferase [Spirochaetia bacterium]